MTKKSYTHTNRTRHDIDYRELHNRAVKNNKDFAQYARMLIAKNGYLQSY